MSEVREILDYDGAVLGELTMPDGTSEDEWAAALAVYTHQPSFQYAYGKPLEEHSFLVLLSQICIDAGSNLYEFFDGITTSADASFIFFKRELSEEDRVTVDLVVEQYVLPDEEPEEQETPMALEEYENNDQAREVGLSIGSFYRTGEFVKVVF